MIDGNQSFDAEVRMTGTDAENRLEIGFATDGYQEALRAEHITQEGRAGAFDEYSRAGRGKSKGVKVSKRIPTQSGKETVENLLKNLECVAKKKAVKGNYAPPMALLLFLDNHLQLSRDNRDRLQAGAEEILCRHAWVFDQVDVVCQRHGLIASWTKSDRHNGT